MATLKNIKDSLMIKDGGLVWHAIDEKRFYKNYFELEKDIEEQVMQFFVDNYLDDIAEYYEGHPFQYYNEIDEIYDYDYKKIKNDFLNNDSGEKNYIIISILTNGAKLHLNKISDLVTIVDANDFLQKESFQEELCHYYFDDLVSIYELDDDDAYIDKIEKIDIVERINQLITWDEDRIINYIRNF